MPDQPDLLFLLHVLARHLRVEADRRARAHGLTRAQWVILFWLNRQPGLSQKELADLLEVEPITVARLLDRLAARGMIARRADPRDRRIWRLELLPPAIPVLDALEAERADMMRMATEGIDPQTISVTKEGLARMKDVFETALRSRVAEAGEPTKDVA